MAVPVLHCFRLKAELLPSELKSKFIYVRPDELAEHVNPRHWELVGPTFHPNSLQTADVERQGYCLRQLPVGLDASKLYNNATEA